jgi:hypothetical protein
MSSRQGAAMICTPNGQPDERDRLGVDADIGAHRQFDAVEHEIHLAQFRRDARRRRRDDGVDRLEQFEDARAIPAAEFLRAIDQRSRHHRAGDQAIAHRGIEILRALAQAIEMQRGAFGCGDDIGRGARTGGLGNLDGLRYSKRLRHLRNGLGCLRKHVVLEIAASDRDPEVADALRQMRRRGLDRARRACGIIGIHALHRVIGQRQIGDAARERAEMVEAENKRK